MDDERRRCPRTPPESTLVVTCCAAEEADGPPYNVAQDLVDLSPGGACLVTAGRLREKLPVIVQIVAPRHSSKFRARGRVRWSRTVGPRSIHLAGVGFEEILEAQGDELRFLGEPAPARTPEPRRRFKRFTPVVAEVTLVPRGLWRTLGLASNAGRRLKDLSLGGAQVLCSRPVRPGRLIELTLQILQPRLTLRAVGDVRWCRRDTLSLEPRWQVGIAFRHLAPGHEANLRTLEKVFLG
jgi:hypothetical protein